MKNPHSCALHKVSAGVMSGMFGLGAHSSRAFYGWFHWVWPVGVYT